MIFLYIGLSIIGIILLLFLFAFLIHKSVFGSRWQKDEYVNYYKPSDFQGLNVQKWQFNLGKETLCGEIYSYENANKGIVVFAHGMWSGMISYTQEMEYFARCGYKVFGFNYEGTDTSSGKNTRCLANSLRCLDAAVNYIKTNYKEEKIFVCGHSWGGFATVNITKFHPDLAAVCGLAPFPSPKIAYKNLMPKPLMILVPFLLVIERIKSGSYATVSAANTLQKTTVPTLIVHSKDDYLLNFDTTTKVLQQTIKNDKVEYLIVNNKGHNPDYTEDAVEYMKTTSAKLKTLPDSQKAEYKKSLDYHRMGALDQSVMNKIIDFFNKY